MVKQDFFVLHSKSNDKVLNEKNDAQAEVTTRFAQPNKRINNDGDSMSTKQRLQKYNKMIQLVNYVLEMFKDVATSSSPREAYSDITDTTTESYKTNVAESNSVQTETSNDRSLDLIAALSAEAIKSVGQLYLTQTVLSSMVSVSAYSGLMTLLDKNDSIRRHNDLKNRRELYLTVTNQIEQLQKQIESLSAHCFQHPQCKAIVEILLENLFSNNTLFVPHNLSSLFDLQCILKRCHHDDSKRPITENYFTFVSQLKSSSKLERLAQLTKMAGEYSLNEKKYHEQLVKTVSKLVARVIKEAANIAGKHVVIIYEKKKGLRLYLVSSSFFTNALYISALNTTKTTFTAIHRSDYRMPIYLPIAIDGLIYRKDLRDRFDSLAHEYLRYSFIFLDTLGEFIQGSASSSNSVNNRSLENM